MYKSLGLVKPNKSFGPERIPGTVWKEFDFELSPISMAIYNASMIQSYVPERIKQMLSRCQSALCQNPLSKNYVKFRLRCPC